MSCSLWCLANTTTAHHSLSWGLPPWWGPLFPSSLWPGDTLAYFVVRTRKRWSSDEQTTQRALETSPKSLLHVTTAGWRVGVSTTWLIRVLVKLTRHQAIPHKFLSSPNPLEGRASHRNRTYILSLREEIKSALVVNNLSLILHFSHLFRRTHQSVSSRNFRLVKFSSDQLQSYFLHDPIFILSWEFVQFFAPRLPALRITYMNKSIYARMAESARKTTPTIQELILECGVVFIHFNYISKPIFVFIPHAAALAPRTRGFVDLVRGGLLQLLHDGYSTVHGREPILFKCTLRK